MDSKTPPSLQLVTAKEMAAILKVPISWIYQRTMQGQAAIPFIKLGKYVRFNPQEVMKHFGMVQKLGESDLPAQEKARRKQEIKRLSMEDMQKWAEDAFRVQGDRDCERAWVRKAIKLFIKTGMANYSSDLEEAKAKCLFLAMAAFYYEFWGIVFQSDLRLNYYDWAQSFEKSGYWVGLLADQRGLKREQAETGDEEDVLAETLEMLANDLRSEMLAGFKRILGNASEIFLFFYAASGESDRDEILGDYDPDRQPAFEFVSAEVG